MRRLNIPTLASKTGAKGTITAEDAAVLRANLLNGEEVWPHEARALFALLQKRLPACDEWTAFIIEALSVYTVDELEPRGALDEKNARWLIAMLRQGQAGWGGLDLAVVRATIEKAGGAPVSLQQFALEIAQHVMTDGRIGQPSGADRPENPAAQPVRLQAGQAAAPASVAA